MTASILAPRSLSGGRASRAAGIGLLVAFGVAGGVYAGTASPGVPMYEGERLPSEQVAVLQAGHGTACSSTALRNVTEEVRCSSPPRLRILRINGRPFPEGAARGEVPAGEVVVDVDCRNDDPPTPQNVSFHVEARTLYELAAKDDQKSCEPYLIRRGRVR